MAKQIYRLYNQLLTKYGGAEKYWPEWCAGTKSKQLREIIAIGAILTQRTSWHNADISLRRLKDESLLSLEAISKLNDNNTLTDLIRPAGFFQTKPRRLVEFANFVTGKYKDIERLGKDNIDDVRNNLLSLYGIGPETADTILLYALDKPSFVIDEYTKRWVTKQKITTDLTYDNLKNTFETNLPQDIKIYQNYHALIIVDQRGRGASKMETITPVPESPAFQNGCK